MSLPSGWSWAGRTFLALDFETTGLDPARDRVVEIGALRFAAAWGEGGPSFREEGALSALVDPGMPMPPAARGIHGISDEDLAGAPPFAAVAPALLALCEGAVIVAHNALFDLSFLRAELARAGLPLPRNAPLDTRNLARESFPGAGSYRLGALSAMLGIDGGRAHRALDDARTCMLLLAACARAGSARVSAGTPAGTARG